MSEDAGSLKTCHSPLIIGKQFYRKTLKVLEKYCVLSMLNINFLLIPVKGRSVAQQIKAVD